MMTAVNDIGDKIVDGLTNFCTAVNDLEFGQAGGAIYNQVRSAIDAQIRQDDTCKLTFPSMIIRPNLRASCLVVILDDHLVVGWKAGMFRKAAAIDIRFATITAIRRQRGSGATRDAQLLVISGDPEVTIAMPVAAVDTVVALVGSAIGMDVG